MEKTKEYSNLKEKPETMTKEDMVLGKMYNHHNAHNIRRDLINKNLNFKVKNSDKEKGYRIAKYFVPWMALWALGACLFCTLIFLLLWIFTPQSTASQVAGSVGAILYFGLAIGFMRNEGFFNMPKSKYYFIEKNGKYNYIKRWDGFRTIFLRMDDYCSTLGALITFLLSILMMAGTIILLSGSKITIFS